MTSPACSSLRLAAALVLLSFATSARAWVETAVTSDAVVVEIDRAGQASVSHELELKVRGGPLRSTTLSGVDADAEVIPGATVTSIRSDGRAKSTDLLLSRGDDESLKLEIDDDKGLRTGSYLLRFAYRTDLQKRGLIRRRGSWIEVGWIGPRFSAGLDVAKVTFRIAGTPTPPRLPESDPNADSLGYGEAPAAAFLSTLHRGAQTDELELVRPHIARGEPVLWRFWASPQAFDVAEGKKAVAAHGPTSMPQTELPTAPRRALPLALTILFSCVLAIGALLKHRFAEINANASGARIRALIPMNAVLRSVLAGAALAAALWLTLRMDQATWGAASVVLTMTLLAYRSARVDRPLRRPGQWLPVSGIEAFAAGRMQSSGRWLDTTFWQGRAVLLLWSVAMLGAGTWLFPRDAYHAILLWLGMPILWPMLLTARCSETPAFAAERRRRWLEKLTAKLGTRSDLRVTPILRFPYGEKEADELRVRIAPRKHSVGLTQIEVGFEQPWKSTQTAPLLLLRVATESQLEKALSPKLPWVRGRRANERVAIATPRLWTVDGTANLVCSIVEMAAHLSRSGQTRLSNHRVRSSAKGSDTSKASTVGLPGHATRAACSANRPFSSPFSGAAPYRTSLTSGDPAAAK